MRTLSAFWLRRLAVAVTAFTLLTTGAVGFAHANPKYAGIVVDAKTGKTLYSYKADSLRYPASLTKMMTMYMMFEAMAEGKMNKNTRIRVSRYAASKPPSKIGIKAGRSIKAEHAILALATKSANDVAAAVAEHLGGTEANFGRLMTRKARQLGMKRTTFKNASGLTAKGQLTTARDMARLGIALREHFPQYYKYFSTRTFKYGKARFNNHNRLLGRVRGVDGIKTGYTRASGFNLVSSVETGGRSIVAVVMGGRSGKSRNAQMQKLISGYLGKATRRSKKRQLIASRKSVGIQVASLSQSIRLPKRGPVPQFRAVAVAQAAKPEINPNKPMQVASAATTSIKAFVEEAEFDQEAVQARLNVPAPVPSTRPQVEVAYAKPQESTSQVIKAVEDIVNKPKGWVVQIGATDSKDKALELLEEVRAKAGSTLRGKGTYTETVAKGDATLHRARFTGFEGKQAARNACKALKRKKIACLAIAA